jgi:membrane-bound lytic murein transglycosylase B
VVDKGEGRDRVRYRHLQPVRQIHAPARFDCTLGEPDVVKPIGEWIKAGFVPAYGRKLRPDELAEPASVLQPEGIYGPAFLTPKNYFVIKDIGVPTLIE